MAKRKRAPHEKPFSRPMPKAQSEATAIEATDNNSTDSDQAEGSNMSTDSIENEAAATEASSTESPAESKASTSGVADQFVGKWNRLISTTNWEKGKIICEWREALIAADAPVTEYSDEAWAQIVGGVTSQHVGRLRRVATRFGDVSTQYAGLHWSHFQACLDWEDAEMWLEGSIQNGWSVSQMRGKRWETVGGTPEEQKAEVAQVEAEQAAALEVEAEAEEASAKAFSEDHDPSKSTEIEAYGGDTDTDEGGLPSNVVPTPSESEVAEPVEKRLRLNVDVESLPDDLAEAFESFKLAIIAHRRENWRDTTPESIVECLESLKQLTLADGE